jgi:hypothetical protein
LGPTSSCDGATGASPSYAVPGGVSGPTGISGTRKTEVWAKISTFTSAPLVIDYYVHPTLNGVPGCPDTGLADSAAFMAAANAGIVGPTSSAFAGLDVTAPFVSLAFTGISANGGVTTGMGLTVPPAARYGGSFPPVNFTLSKAFVYRSGSHFAPLRHRFASNASFTRSSDSKVIPANTMVLVGRSYPSRGSGSCGERITMETPPGTINTAATCAAFIVNVNGHGICIAANGSTVSTTNAGWAKLAGHNDFSPKCVVGDPACLHGFPFLPN